MSYKAMYKRQRIGGASGGGGSSAPAGSNIPSGGIIMWSGSEAPEGWAICDGQNGTPDLRGRFVLGQSDSHSLGETGGAEKVTMIVSQMPFHQHIIATSTTGTAVFTDTWVNASKGSGSSTHKDAAVVSGAGGNQPHENMPPYYTLAYIMKL